MKQLIVLVATVILGIAIGVMVMGFKAQAKSIGDIAGSKIEDIINVYDTGD